jgi:hypothetical protein
MNPFSMSHPTESSTSEDERQSTNNALDLEKQETQAQSIHNAPLNITSSSRQRVTRTQSLTRRNTNRGRFTHPLSHVKTTEEEIVDFDGPDDPYRPINWPFRKKVVTTLLYGLTTMGSTWASSVYSPAISQISDEYHVGTEVSLLGLSFLLLGFGLGPLLWAPLSEV